MGVPLLVRDLVENNNHLFGDVAIICRTWGHVKSMADALQQAAIPVDIHVEKFFNVPIVKDVLAWGHLIAEDEQAEAGLFRILKTPLGHDWTSKFYNDCPRETITERLAAIAKQAKDNTTISWVLSAREKLLDTLRQKPGPDEMVWAILSILKQTPRLQQLRTNYRYQDRLNLANMGRIMSLAERFTTIETKPSLGSWLHYMNILQMNLTLDAAQPLGYDQQAAVQVLTVHQAKGLEFPIVIVPFLRAGSFPMRLQRPKVLDCIPENWKKWSAVNTAAANEAYLQEERRVFHVACTRAEDELYLYGPIKAQSIFTKELELDNPETMEIRAMTITEEALQQPKLTEQKQRLLVDLSREIAAHQYDNASHIRNSI
jgi:DNA helicase-2/ATP-dependent DNA helicase PcrA